MAKSATATRPDSTEPRPPSPVPSQTETDRQMLGWLREQFSHFKEGAYGRRYADAIIARFGELIAHQETFKRSLECIQDANKLAMHQMQFAQSALRQLERQMDLVEHHGGNGNGAKANPAPELDLKGQ